MLLLMLFKAAFEALYAYEPPELLSAIEPTRDDLDQHMSTSPIVVLRTMINQPTYYKFVAGKI